MTAKELVEEASYDPRANPWEREFVEELVAKAIAQEREECAKVGERVAGYYSKNNGDNKDVAFLVAQEIRERR